VIDEAMAANPQSALPLQVKGEMQWSRGDPAGAVRLFDEALKIDPKYQLARLSRAHANVLRGEFAAADEVRSCRLPPATLGAITCVAWSMLSKANLRRPTGPWTVSAKEPGVCGGWPRFGIALQRQGGCCRALRPFPARC
jgi:hypothetical protein